MDNISIQKQVENLRQQLKVDRVPLSRTLMEWVENVFILFYLFIYFLVVRLVPIIIHFIDKDGLIQIIEQR